MGSLGPAQAEAAGRAKLLAKLARPLQGDEEQGGACFTRPWVELAADGQPVQCALPVELAISRAGSCGA